MEPLPKTQVNLICPPSKWVNFFNDGKAQTSSAIFSINFNEPCAKLSKNSLIYLSVLFLNLHFKCYQSVFLLKRDHVTFNNYTCRLQWTSRHCWLSSWRFVRVLLVDKIFRIVSSIIKLKMIIVLTALLYFNVF
jgi:hypothetical protein